MYHGRQWAFIEEHLYDTLGKSSRDSGDLLTAVQHFMHMLPCPQSSPHWQGVYLQQLLDAVQQASHKQVGQVPACLQGSVTGPGNLGHSLPADPQCCTAMCGAVDTLLTCSCSFGLRWPH